MLPFYSSRTSNRGEEAKTRQSWVRLGIKKKELGMKYAHSSNEANHGVKFCQSTCDASRIRCRMGNESVQKETHSSHYGLLYSLANKPFLQNPR